MKTVKLKVYNGRHNLYWDYLALAALAGALLKTFVVPQKIEEL